MLSGEDFLNSELVTEGLFISWIERRELFRFGRLVIGVKFTKHRFLCGISSVVERQLPKLETRVRLPYPAHNKYPRFLGYIKIY